ncbi:MAG: hypothetical protein IJT00_07805, partial [Lachnospiraceae bacterium]|nr:hypothetical protein [Lachnospiraceae bacterium]
ETFVGLHGRDHVLLVLAEGEPEESFPEILLHEDIITRDENGSETTVRVDREPLAADCRGNDNRERLKALDDVVLKLCAAIFGLNYDDLKQRHRERMIRRRVTALSAALAIVTVFAVTCLFFMLRINGQKRVIADKYAGAMATASRELLSMGLKKDALYAARSVLPENRSKGFNADAYRTLVNALAPYETDSSYFPEESFKIPTDILGMELSEDMSRALVFCPGYSVLIDTASSEVLARIDSEQAVLDDSGVTFVNEDCRVIHVYADPYVSNSPMLAEYETRPEIHYDPQSRTTVLFTEKGIEGYRKQERAFEVSPEGWTDDAPVEALAFSGDGSSAAFVFENINGLEAGLLDLRSGDLKTMDIDVYLGSPAVATDGKTVWLYYEEDYTYENAGNTGHMMKLDVAGSGILEDRRIPGEGFYRICRGSDGMLLVSDSLAYVMDEDLEITSVVSGYMDAVCVFPYEGGFVIMDRTGAMYTDGVLPGEERSFELYGHDAGKYISVGIYNREKDSFCICYDEGGNAVIYSGERAPCGPESASGEMIPVGAADISGDGEDEGVPNGLQENEIFHAEVSEDGKYRAVSTYDGTLHLFDFASGRKVKELYNTGVLLSHDTFPYLEKAGVYIIENRVFDEDMNCISDLPNGNITAKGSDEKSVFLLSRYEPDLYHRIRIVPYEEMLKRADELLNDYVPDRSVLDRYSIY